MSQEQPAADAELQALPQQPTQVPVQITTVQLKLPILAERPSTLVHANRTTRSITASRMKFNHVVASLAPEYATELWDLLMNPPEDTPYEVLKRELTKRTSASKQR